MARDAAETDGGGRADLRLAEVGVHHADAEAGAERAGERVDQRGLADVSGTDDQREHPRVDRDGPLACIQAAYVWTDGEVRRRGRLMMLVVAEGGRPRIHALTFAYDA